MTGVTREALLAAVAASRRVEAVPVPEWGVTVHVRTLSVPASLDLERQIEAAGEDAAKRIGAQLVAFVCDEAGQPILTAADAGAMLETSAGVQRVLAAGFRLNQVNGEARAGN